MLAIPIPAISMALIETNDKNWEKLSTKLEFEYFHQVSERIKFDLSRFQTILELQYVPFNKWGIILGIVQENYSETQKISFRPNPTNVYLSISRSGLIN